MSQSLRLALSTDRRLLCAPGRQDHESNTMVNTGRPSQVCRMNQTKTGQSRPSPSMMRQDISSVPAMDVQSQESWLRSQELNHP
jgi:hypothetical protein